VGRVPAGRTIAPPHPLLDDHRVTRLAHIDLLRVALTVGVIATHATITYGGPGSPSWRA